jgi:hypothetical protein
VVSRGIGVGPDGGRVRGADGAELNAGTEFVADAPVFG